MRTYLILISLLCILSCKKNTNIVSQENTIETTHKEDKDSILFKTIGTRAIKNHDFPKEWFVNTYGKENIQLKKEDVDAQKKLEEIDYFNKIKGIKNENRNSFYSNFIKKDSLLSIAKVDSLFVLDSISLSNNRKIITIKTIATLDDKNYDMPITIYKIDLVLFDHANKTNSINIFSEIDYPYTTKKNICYLNKDGILFCREFTIEEEKTINKRTYNINSKKVFNLK